jgi:hypothetical protein
MLLVGLGIHPGELFLYTGEMADGRDWAVIVPSYLMVIVLLAYWSYAALTPLLSPSFDSPDLIVGGYPLSILG